jgi:hypothetical protein
VLLYAKFSASQILLCALWNSLSKSSLAYLEERLCCHFRSAEVVCDFKIGAVEPREPNGKEIEGMESHRDRHI